MDWIRQLLGGHDDSPKPAPPPIDETTVRDRMTRADPDFARARHQLHEAIQVLTAKRAWEGIVRDERLRAELERRRIEQSGRRETHD